ncbi:MAG: 4Fe-4S binding protein [Dehalococcoidia bacterium]|nr:4Fe-4S binding protein [Dehalococcoidia bacterium]
MVQTASKRKTKVTIRERWCKGCGICVAFCPLGVRCLSEENKAFVDKDVCNRCRICERFCPDFAIDTGGEDDY